MDEREQLRDEGAYQVDVVVAFFVILLILLVSLSSVTQPREGRQVDRSYLSKDALTEQFDLRSLCSPYRFRSLWILVNGNLAEIDLRVVVRLLMEAPTRGAESIELQVDGIGIEYEFQSEPTTFRLELAFYANAGNGVLFKRVFPGVNPTATAQELGRQMIQPMLIYVFPGQQRLAHMLEATLRRAGIVVQIEYLQGPRIVWQRRPERFRTHQIQRVC